MPIKGMEVFVSPYHDSSVPDYRQVRCVCSSPDSGGCLPMFFLLGGFQVAWCENVRKVRQNWIFGGDKKCAKSETK